VVKFSLFKLLDKIAQTIHVTGWTGKLEQVVLNAKKDRGEMEDFN